MKKQIKPSVPISIKHNGKEYCGSYEVQGKVIKVYSSMGMKVTQLGGLSPSSLARILLSEIVTQAKKQ